MNRALETLMKNRYVLLLLPAGTALLLPPAGGGGGAEGSAATEEERRLEAVLSAVEGVGEVGALYSDNGVVVVCEGAGSAAVRLRVTEAAAAYTGFGSDRITVLKMKTD